MVGATAGPVIRDRAWGLWAPAPIDCAGRPP